MPFTTLQFLHRLTRRLKVRDLGNISGADRIELQDAANAGLAEFISLLPPSRRDTPDSQVMRAPLSLTVSINQGAKGFTYVGGDPFPNDKYSDEEALVGHSVVIAGDQRLNRLHRTGELVSPYIGTSGERAAVFYGDCVQMSRNDERIIDHPIYHDDRGQIILEPLGEEMRRYLGDRQRTTEQISTGRPQFYWTESILGSERVSTPLWLLRVWPIPLVIGAVSYRVEALPTEITIEDFSTPRDLPVELREVRHLVALCEENLIGSDMLSPQAKPEVMQTAAAKAREALRSYLPLSSESNWCGTPPGY